MLFSVHNFLVFCVDFLAIWLINDLRKSLIRFKLIPVVLYGAVGLFVITNASIIALKSELHLSRNKLALLNIAVRSA
jgi:hypothetical protein